MRRGLTGLAGRPAGQSLGGIPRPMAPADYARSGIDPPEIRYSQGEMLAEIVVARIKSLSLASLSLDISLSNTTTMASSDAEMDDSNTGSVLTDALRTEALEARSMMPAEFQQPP